MSDRLDRIEAILQSVAEQQAANTQDIDALIEAISTTDLLVRENIRNIQENRQITEASVQADREEYRALNAEQSQRIENLLNDARADRKRADEERQRADEYRQRADAERAEQSQRIENLLNEASADRERGDAERAENRRRFDAQQQIIQAMLVELSVVNSRLDFIERAS
jgi:hypothetical protein